jgi:hypothetical protein
MKSKSFLCWVLLATLLPGPLASASCGDLYARYRYGHRKQEPVRNSNKLQIGGFLGYAGVLLVEGLVTKSLKDSHVYAAIGIFLVGRSNAKVRVGKNPFMTVLELIEQAKLGSGERLDKFCNYVIDKTRKLNPEVRLDRADVLTALLKADQAETFCKDPAHPLDYDGIKKFMAAELAKPGSEKLYRDDTLVPLSSLEEKTSEPEAEPEPKLD